MKSLAALFVLALSFQASALEWVSVEDIKHNGYYWTHNKIFGFLPMTEKVANQFAALDKNTSYTCEIKTAVSSITALATYGLKNCKAQE